MPSVLVFTDVIGVCKEAMDMSSVTQRSTGRELRKREIQLLDNTNREVLYSESHPAIRVLYRDRHLIKEYTQVLNKT